VGQQRERGSRRGWPDRQAPIDQAPIDQAPIDQAPTQRYASPGAATADDALPTLDQPMTLPSQTTQTTRTLTSASRARRATGAASPAPPADAQPTRAPAPLKTGDERNRALAKANAASAAPTTLIPGARRYRPPTVSVVPRHKGPRSAVTQFAVSMIVTAILVSALALSTPLGQAAALDVNGPLHTYANAAPWLPTPTPTPKPANSFRPPTSANPGQQAVINEIVAVFGPYSQGALAISKCESGYDPNAWNSYPILNSHASGVFQILYPSTWNTTSYASQSPFNASANIHAAYQIFSRDGYSWREWQCKP
jgi:hypothetical protein